MHALNKQIPVLILVSILLTVVRCNTRQATGTGGTGSETVIGMVALKDGSPASSSIVTLFPEEYDPIADTPLLPSMSDTTDSNGMYSIRLPDSTLNYSIMATDQATGNSAFVTGIIVTEEITHVPDAVLSEPGAVSVVVPDSLSGGYVYIPGTDIAVYVNTNNLALLEQVPAAIFPSINYVSDAAPGTSSILITNIAVPSGDTLVLPYPQWRNFTKIYLNTSVTGAGITEDVTDFPVLIRLTNEVFNFAQAHEDGSDIRFTKNDGTSLSFEIERWNATDELAEVWVTVDTVYGNSSNQYIIMYWGNDEVVAESNSIQVFDTAKGFQGVWHLAEDATNEAGDATGNHFKGTRYGMNESGTVSGCIGNALHFDGVDDYIVAHGTADGALDFPANGSYALSLWAYADNIDSLWHGIAGKGHRQYYLQYKCFHDTAASWEFVEYQGGWNFSEFRTDETPYDKEWVYLTGIRNGEQQLLYVNGQLVVDTTLSNASEEERNTEGDFTIGCHLQYELFPEMVGWDLTFFNGIIDEVRVMNTVPDSNWIKLCYMNQKTVDALVEFR